jgi:aspartate dehydrogenase
MDTALIGCGFIGTLIAEHIAAGNLPLKLRLVLDRNPEKVERIQRLFENPPKVASSVEDIASSSVDLVIEAASIEAVHNFAKPLLSTGKDMMIMSVGAFSTPGFYNTAEEICNRNQAKVYLPSGAIGGLDAISAAAAGKLYDVSLTTIKNPRSLQGAPYVVEKGIKLSEISERMTIFSGTATEAIEGFPANVNVAAALGIVGVGAIQTRVEIIAEPGVEKNIHEIQAKGDFGKLWFRAENRPSTDNPKTSLLAALSAISLLNKITSPIKVG